MNLRTTLPPHRFLPITQGLFPLVHLPERIRLLAFPILARMSMLLRLAKASSALFRTIDMER